MFFFSIIWSLTTFCWLSGHSKITGSLLNASFFVFIVCFARLSVSFFKKLVNLYENLFFWFLFSDHLALATCCWLNGRSETAEILLYAIGCLFVCFFF